MSPRPDRPFDLEGRLLQYSAAIMRLEDKLPRSRSGNPVAGQLLRSGTSPLSNHGEAQAAESRNDFIHKMSICLKELKETRRWLRLIALVPLEHDPETQRWLLDETEELVKIFAASIATAERNRDQGN